MPTRKIASLILLLAGALACQEAVRQLPERPGVYLMRDARDVTSLEE